MCGKFVETMGPNLRCPLHWSELKIPFDIIETVPQMVYLLWLYYPKPRAERHQ